MTPMTGAERDAAIDAGTHCPLCASPYAVQPARPDTFDRPVLVCTGTRDDRCDFWVYDRSPEADAAAEQAREDRRLESERSDALRAPKRTRKALPMTPLDPSRTRHAVWFGPTGRAVRQIAEAASADGVWLYHREDDGGTTWTVVHVPSGRMCPLEPSLRQARIGTASGWTLRELDRLDAQRARWAELAGASA